MNVINDVILNSVFNYELHLGIPVLRVDSLCLRNSEDVDPHASVYLYE